NPPHTRRGRPVTSIHLTPAKRQALLDNYRRSAEPGVRLRAHILLLLAGGHPWATIGAVLFCSTSTVSRWRWRSEKDVAATVFGRPRGRRKSGVHIWAVLENRHTRMLRKKRRPTSTGSSREVRLHARPLATI